MRQFRFFHDLNLVVMEHGERIDDRSLLESLLAVYDHPDFVPGMDEIASFLGTRAVEVTASGLRGIARSFPRPGHENAEPNLLAVVTTTKLGHGLSRLYGAHAYRDGEVALEILATLAEACDWLDRSRGRSPGTTRAVVL
ncbi:MAG: hypothetical protein RIC56_17755 [Pseudomonadales bacterium]